MGGQDELVFDGASFALDHAGAARRQLPAWREEIEHGLDGCATSASGPAGLPGRATRPSPERLESIYRRMMLGLADYVRKNRFNGVLIGLSGGIDSAMSAAVAADALGPDRVACVMMPSPYTSPDSLEDAAEVARLLGVRLDTIAIDRRWRPSRPCWRRLFDGPQPDITEENIQSRSRGLTLMALSNKFGSHGAVDRQQVAKCRSATPRSMATCAAAIRC